MNYTCKQLFDISNTLGLNGCYATLVDVTMGLVELPSYMPEEYRIIDACPKTCGFCNDSCIDNPLMSSPDGSTLSCSELKAISNNNCSQILRDINTSYQSKALPISIDTSSRLDVVCTRTCDACGLYECKDNPLLEETGYTCEEVVEHSIDGCEATLASFGVTLPSGIPPEAKVKDACLKTCNICTGDYTPPSSTCVDDPVVRRMNLHCSTLIQYAINGCDSTLMSVIGSLYNPVKYGLHELTTVGEVCQQSCGICNSPDKGRCVDSAVVEEFTTCRALILMGCNAVIDERYPEYGIPEGVRVRDVCRRSCGLCGEATCDDNFQNGEELGVDCGGGCRPCNSCSSNSLKIYGEEYVVEGVGYEHLASRLIYCSEGHEATSGNLQTTIYCMDGSFQPAAINCVKEKLHVLSGLLVLQNASDLDYTAIPSICASLVSVYGMIPHEDIKISAVSATPIVWDEPAGCVDTLDAMNLGFTCSLLASACDMKLSVIVEAAKINLGPEYDDLLEDSYVSAICEATCALCGVSTSDLDGGESSYDSGLYIYYMILEESSKLIPKEFVCDSSVFTNQLAVHFIRNDIKISKDGEELEASRALTDRPMTASFTELEASRVSSTVWSRYYGYSSASSDAVYTFRKEGLPNPTMQPVVAVWGGEGGGDPHTPLPSSMYSGRVAVDYGSGSTLHSEMLEASITPSVAANKHKCNTLAAADVNSCCQLQVELQTFLKGECGELLYGVEATQERVREFCEGPVIKRDPSDSSLSCKKRILSLIKRFDKKGGVGCELNAFVSTVVSSWCLETFNGGYCFPSAVKDLEESQFFSILFKPPSELDTMCLRNSCTRSSIRYFGALTQLQLAWKDVWSTSLSGRYLREDVTTSEYPILAEHMQKSMYVLQSNTNGLFELSESVRRLMNIHVGGRGGGDTSMGVGRRLQMSKMMETPLAQANENWLDLICLKVDEDYCQQTLLLLLEESPINNPMLVKDPCASRCFVPVTGAAGVLIQTYGEVSGHPYYSALGGLMRGYGRFYCSQNAQKKYCGDYLFKNINSIAGTGEGYQQTVKRLDDCKCPPSYVGDGYCDIECYNEECGWDAEDCLVKRMFPEIYLALERVVAPVCNMYSKHFQCTYECKNEFDVAQLTDGRGCCLTSALEQFGDILLMEMRHPLTASSRIVWNPSRSTAYVEQLCDASFDRTCSNGGSRDITSMEVLFNNVDTRSYFTDEELVKGVETVVIGVVSRELNLVDRDFVRAVTRGLTRKVSIELDIDASPVKDIWYKKLLDQAFLLDLESAIEKVVVGLPLKQHAYSKSELISVSIPPEAIYTEFMTSSPITMSTGLVLPFEGTRGLSDLEIRLPKKNCTRDFTRITAGYVFDEENESETDIQIKHDKTRFVKCAPNYHSFHGSQKGKVKCDNGKWVVEGQLDCRKDCTISLESKYELERGYIIFGGGNHHGAFRTLQCAPGYSSHYEATSQTVRCIDGSWTHLFLECRKSCPSFPALADRYIVTGYGTKHGDQRIISCSEGYVGRGMALTDTHGLVACYNGEWTPLRFECVLPQVPTQRNPPSTLEQIFQQIFTGPGVLAILILAIGLFVTALIIFVAWKFYFNQKAHRAIGDREKKVQAFHEAHTGDDGDDGGGKVSESGGVEVFERRKRHGGDGYTSTADDGLNDLNYTRDSSIDEHPEALRLADSMMDRSYTSIEHSIMNMNDGRQYERTRGIQKQRAVQPLVALPSYLPSVSTPASRMRSKISKNNKQNITEYEERGLRRNEVSRCTSNNKTNPSSSNHNTRYRTSNFVNKPTPSSYDMYRSDDGGAAHNEVIPYVRASIAADGEHMRGGRSSKLSSYAYDEKPHRRKYEYDHPSHTSIDSRRLWDERMVDMTQRMRVVDAKHSMMHHRNHFFNVDEEEDFGYDRRRRRAKHIPVEVISSDSDT